MNEQMTIRCPTCGAECFAGSAYCGTCGSALVAKQSSLAQPTLHTPSVPGPTSAPESPWVEWPPSPTPSQPGATPNMPPASGAPTPSQPAASSEGAVALRRCDWCGAVSPADASRCAQCGATFPIPEQDEVIIRAAEERLRNAQETLETMRRQRSRRGIGRLFDN